MQEQNRGKWTIAGWTVTPTPVWQRPANNLERHEDSLRDIFVGNEGTLKIQSRAGHGNQARKGTASLGDQVWFGSKTKFRGDQSMSAFASKAVISRFMSTRPSQKGTGAKSRVSLQWRISSSENFGGEGRISPMCEPSAFILPAVNGRTLRFPLHPKPRQRRLQPSADPHRRDPQREPGCIVGLDRDTAQGRYAMRRLKSTGGNA